MKSFLFGGCSPTGACVQGTYAFFRVAVGLAMALLHGWGKLPPSEGLVGGVGGLGLPVPELWAWGVALVEFVGGLFIAIGLLTRPAAMALGIVMAVAFLGIHGGALKGENSGEMALLYLLCSIFIASFGSGKYGIDPKLRP